MTSIMRSDLVFEGGGMKGIGLVGALSVLEEHGYVAERRAGASAGAIVAALHAAGYSASELRRILAGFSFGDFLDMGWEDRIPLVGKALSALFELGVYEGDAIEEWLARTLALKGVVTFGNLRRDYDGDDPRLMWKAQVVVSDVTKHEMLVLPMDARRKLGVEPDDLSVALAVRASLSIPVFFEPVRFPNPETGEEHLLVDGGMLSNFPVWLFDQPEPQWPTFGLMLAETSTRGALAKGFVDPVTMGFRVPAVRYAISLVQTMLEAHDRLYIEQSDFARTIAIPTLGVGTTEFDLDETRRDALFDSGRRAAEKFLPFDFDGYVAAFRSGTRHSRRASVRKIIATAR